MDVSIIVTIVGSFITLALIINGFFLRGIYAKQIEIELKLTKLWVRKEDITRRVGELEINEKEIFKRLNKLDIKANNS